MSYIFIGLSKLFLFSGVSREKTAPLIRKIIDISLNRLFPFFQSDDFSLTCQPFMGSQFTPSQLQHLQPIRKEEIVRLRNDGGSITIVETQPGGKSFFGVRFGEGLIGHFWERQFFFFF